MHVVPQSCCRHKLQNVSNRLLEPYAPKQYERHCAKKTCGFVHLPVQVFLHNFTGLYCNILQSFAVTVLVLENYVFMKVNKNPTRISMVSDLTNSCWIFCESFSWNCQYPGNHSLLQTTRTAVVIFSVFSQNPKDTIVPRTF